MLSALAAGDSDFFVSLGYGTTTSGYGQGIRMGVGYRFNQYLSVDGGFAAYSMSGSSGNTLIGSTSSSAQADISQITLTGLLPLSEETGIFVKAGGYAGRIAQPAF